MVRDTSSDWVLIGESEPWYGVLSADKFRRANLTSEAVEEFYAQGRSEMGESVAILTSLFHFTHAPVALDIGSGLGRLAFAMRDHADQVFGVDVAAGMIREANAQAGLRGVTGVSFGHTLPEGQTVDWINSFIVFQHIAPDAGCALLDANLQRLNRDGWISVQLTYCHDSRHTTELNRDVAVYVFDGQSMRVLEENPHVPGAMMMYDYDLNRVMRLLHKNGIRDVFTRHTDHGGAHGIWLYGRRTG